MGDHFDYRFSTALMKLWCIEHVAIITYQPFTRFIKDLIHIFYKQVYTFSSLFVPVLCYMWILAQQTKFHTFHVYATETVCTPFVTVIWMIFKFVVSPSCKHGWLDGCIVYLKLPKVVSHWCSAYCHSPYHVETRPKIFTVQPKRPQIPIMYPV